MNLKEPTEWGKVVALLNEQQRQAVMHGEGPLLVLAGAGSGKTRVITYRIAKLIIEDGVRPENILAVTFTNKAAAEMRSRLVGLIPQHASRLTAGTFHSICARLLRFHAEALGYSRDFAIYDRDDQKVVASRALEKLGYDPKLFPALQVVNRISYFKTRLLEPDDIEPRSELEQVAAEVYPIYQEMLRELGALDFGDLIMLMVRLLQKDRALRQHYSNRWRQILVDEFQDTNVAQLELLKLLTSEHKNICAVGDDDQSIYSWRGAEVRNILEFPKVFPNAKIVMLERNYRSTSQILECANAVIAGMHKRHPKKLWTVKRDGRKPVVFGAIDAHEEAEFVAETVEDLVKFGGFRYGEIAVFYRSNYQSRVFEDVFLAHGIPYQIVGGLRFYERKEIKDLLAYLRLLFSPADDVAFLRIVNTPPRGIGNATIEKIKQIAETKALPLLEAAKLAVSERLVSDSTRARIARFIDLYSALSQAAKELRPSEVLRAIYEETGYKAALEREGGVEAESRMENINELMAVLEEYESEGMSLQEILDTIALRSDADDYKDRTETVAFMTVHSAKGLEFRVVFLTGLEEGVLPSWHSFEEEGSARIDEERRLCYVGMTRAKERLFLSWAQFRPRSYSRGPSRFLFDIPSSLVVYKGIPLDPELGSAAPVREYEVSQLAEVIPFKSRSNHASSGRRDFYAGLEPYMPARPGRPETGVPTYAPERITPEYIRSGKPIPKDRTPRAKRETVNPNQFESSSEFKKGEYAYHPKFGVGRVVKVKGKGEDATVEVAFPGRPIVKLKARFLKKRKE